MSLSCERSTDCNVMPFFARRHDDNGLSALVSRILFYSFGTIVLTLALAVVLFVAGLRETARDLALIWGGTFVVLEVFRAAIRGLASRRSPADATGLRSR